MFFGNFWHCFALFAILLYFLVFLANFWTFPHNPKGCSCLFQCRLGFSNWICWSFSVQCVRQATTPAIEGVTKGIYIWVPALVLIWKKYQQGVSESLFSQHTSFTIIHCGPIPKVTKTSSKHASAARRWRSSHRIRFKGSYPIIWAFLNLQILSGFCCVMVAVDDTKISLWAQPGGLHLLGLWYSVVALVK